MPKFFLGVVKRTGRNYKVFHQDNFDKSLAKQRNLGLPKHNMLKIHMLCE